MQLNNNNNLQNNAILQRNAVIDRIKDHILFTVSIVNLIIAAALLWVPFCKNKRKSVIPFDVIRYDATSIDAVVIFALLAISLVISFVLFLRVVKHYTQRDIRLSSSVCKLIVSTAITSCCYFLGGVIYSSICNMFGGKYTAGPTFIPFALVLLSAVIFAFASKQKEENEESNKNNRKLFFIKLEFFIYSLLAAVFTMICCLSDIFTVDVEKPASVKMIEVNGFRLLTSSEDSIESLQFINFMLIVFITVISVLFVLSLVSFISRSKLFFKVTFAEIFFSGLFSLLIGILGKYYEIALKINEETIKALLDGYISTTAFEIVYTVRSSSLIWFFVVVGIIIVTFIRKPYTKGILAEGLEDRIGSRKKMSPSHSASTKPTASEGFDPCPAFTELDNEETSLLAKTSEAEQSSFIQPTLQNLVQYVVSYARDSRLHLSYTEQDIAAFIAGLGATKLTILQGMSGTGKTSLPKIFTEAILGRCEIIEIESSWRDKNELLGYYNEFNHVYTPKKFTSALYRAALDQKRVTFIVLDEMNLSRIEYYFSDFLSIMEHEEDKREIKLLNVGLFFDDGAQTISYKALSGGHTLKIPSNVWFIGTANRDESTFEISDKVYDRAHTINFNKRAPKVNSVHEPLPQQYLSYDNLLALLEEAKESVRFDIDTCTVIREVEELLKPYNISFGNRIANQIESFVKIYTACFPSSQTATEEAVETILLSKIVSKLELKSVENKEELASRFEDLGLTRCSDFIIKLNED